MSHEDDLENEGVLSPIPRRRSLSDADVCYSRKETSTSSFYSNDRIPIFGSGSRYDSKVPEYLDIDRHSVRFKSGTFSFNRRSFVRIKCKTLGEKLRQDDDSLVYKQKLRLNYDKIVRDNKIWEVIPNPIYFDFDIKSKDVIIISNSILYDLYRYLLLCGFTDKVTYFSVLPIELIKLIHHIAYVDDCQFHHNVSEWWNHMWIDNIRYTRLDKFIIALFTKVRARTWYTSKVGEESELIRRPISALEAANNITRIIVLKEIGGSEIFTFDDNYNQTGDISMLQPHIISALIHILNSNKH